MSGRGGRGGIRLTASSKSENDYLLANIVDGDNGIEREVISRAKMLVYSVYIRQKTPHTQSPSLFCL